MLAKPAVVPWPLIFTPAFNQTSTSYSWRLNPVPRVAYSDHLPLVVNFDVDVADDRRAAAREPSCHCPTYEGLNAVGLR